LFLMTATMSNKLLTLQHKSNMKLFGSEIQNKLPRAGTFII
jgi:hypothetical protein